MTKFIIKYGPLYFDKHISITGTFSRDIEQATQYAHPDNANYDIETMKLPSECKVYQLNYVELEIK